MEDKKLNELANDFFEFLQGKPTKQKRLRPLVKQLNYKGKTIKWTEDGQGNFNGWVGGNVGKPAWEWLKKEDESSKDFVKRMIDEGMLD